MSGVGDPSANTAIITYDAIVTPVSEAVTNAIIHGYEEKVGYVLMRCILKEKQLTVCVQDFGQGIADIARAREPFYTTKPELERSGMGFAFMETFMDHVEVTSEIGVGTTVTMTKQLQDQT